MAKSKIRNSTSRPTSGIKDNMFTQLQQAASQLGSVGSQKQKRVGVNHDRNGVRSRSQQPKLPVETQNLVNQEKKMRGSTAAY